MIGFVAGLAVGAALSGALLAGRPRVQRLSLRESDTLTDADRQSAAAEFASHKEAMQRQVSDYADQLAGDDKALRELLRVVEQRSATSASSGPGRQ